MELEYTISNEDSLTGALFLVSQAPITKKRRFREQFIYPAIYLFLGGTLLYMNNYITGLAVFITLIILWVTFFSSISKYAIKRSYLKKIRSQKNNSDSIKVKLKIERDSLVIIDQSGESAIKISDIGRIVEIKNYLFIGIKGYGHLTIPRNNVESGNIDSFIKKLVKMSKVNPIKMLDWKWK